ncbi:MAG: GIY-YIG nuclease family protein [Faecalibacterium sp.]
MTKAELYQKACMLPLLPGVYIIRDKSDTIIYIGKAKRLRIRVSQYFREGCAPRQQGQPDDRPRLCV